MNCFRKMCSQTSRKKIGRERGTMQILKQNKTTKRLTNERQTTKNNNK